MLAVLREIIPPEEKLMLIGHSLGGAIAIRIAATKFCSNLVGTMVIDVVEGTALAALEHMSTILAKRPDHFNSISEAIQWSIRTGAVHNTESARVSVPSQLVHQSSRYTWRTDLPGSQPHWRGWFDGISEMFLELPGHKVLLLAGERLFSCGLIHCEPFCHDRYGSSRYSPYTWTNARQISVATNVWMWPYDSRR